ncbi:hypothetical protein CPT_Privateer_061 [Proteus phage Privateer]|uniref:Uncharacterized protein n=1 Tax=Proteus phage Privateer TaxID=2712958 RepID=A0A6G8R3U1_9CAUD|nr:hypothetical protein HWD17_gp061 [Proteus phage Privateer]QIN94854.1 hypothetical protein CPT_Privateer_061 [Proteus phage Privateer]
MGTLSKREINFLIKEARKEVKTYKFLNNGDALYLMFRHFYPALSETIENESVFDENDFNKLKKMMVENYVK